MSVEVKGKPKYLWTLEAIRGSSDNASEGKMG